MCVCVGTKVFKHASVELKSSDMPDLEDLKVLKADNHFKNYLLFMNVIKLAQTAASRGSTGPCD